MEGRYSFENDDLFRTLCGIADQNLPSLEENLDVQLIARGNQFLIGGAAPQVQLAIDFFRRVASDYDQRPRHGLEEFDIKYILSMLQKNRQMNEANEHQVALFDEDPVEALGSTTQKVFVTARGKPIYPRTHRQASYLESVQTQPITFCLGPAGTGKTFLAIVTACRKLMNGEVDRIILTRPAVEAGESLGFLPGDLNQKVDPYLRPVYDALYECLGIEKVHSLIAARRIEIAPLAYMRGRTLNQAMVVLDEAQNCTLAQLKMFLTRLGRNSSMCIGGDETQVDLNPGRSGLLKAAEILSHVPGISIIRFGKEDIVRNAIVERIVAAFEKEEGL
ncbi:MAG: PhoH family protein [Leptospiraceae bacterium]|nr:PhoH family protein [Leptospiraceae bacterium]MCB1303763.1 PhoH family protein [Leptospiraceae bacterium]